MALSLELIIRTARSLLIQYGLQDVSMRRLAKELDVAPGALYYHVPSKQELLRTVAHEILTPLRTESGDALQLMLRFRELVLPLRDVGDLLLLAYALDVSLPPAQLLPERLVTAGWPRDEARDTTAVVMRFALGAVATEQNQALLERPATATATATAAGQAPDAPQAMEAERIYLHGLQRLLIRPV
ncbi:TetR/AcrR family transcriptional regulator [Nesterenkonia sp. DZ6]|uniref:TetR/AcrR family transcriptional regulator n=1 Tax=Nesterenkonia sp. DZ6 TaxID=2901229 RepID=UPI001F4CCB31|nr:TetR/AcrR family transcriptional regulator [Nesterenkonia sp. DZ6]MCH8560710.1 TetR/AcrR family transcriptional regulator [Nesterenkonia sp. DZ6]